MSDFTLGVVNVDHTQGVVTVWDGECLGGEHLTIVSSRVHKKVLMISQKHGHAKNVPFTSGDVA